MDIDYISDVCLRLGMYAQVEPFLPYEYTSEGMLERLNAYIHHQVCFLFMYARTHHTHTLQIIY